MTQDILFDRNGAWGLVTLNRPAALNALTWKMVEAFRSQIIEWERDHEVRAVLIKGAGEKAFCAGGDIRWLYDAAKSDPAHACGFFREEYRLNAALHHCSKPIVSLIDGVVMGGGVGVSVHGAFRVAGDRTLFAMPETGIGLFPDVGGGYFMPRLKDGLGLYFALTGARAKAADCVAAGIATHYAPTDRIGELEAALLSIRSFGGDAHGAVEAVLDAQAHDPGSAQINADRAKIKSAFGAPRGVNDLLQALRADGSPFSTHALETLARMSPTSLKITFEQLRRGQTMDFNSVMAMEFRIVRRVMDGHDFFEGVRALLIDKDKNPQWRPARLEDVSENEIARYFEPLGAEELSLP